MKRLRKQTKTRASFRGIPGPSAAVATMLPHEPTHRTAISRRLEGADERTGEDQSDL